MASHKPPHHQVRADFDRALPQARALYARLMVLEKSDEWRDVIKQAIQDTAPGDVWPVCCLAPDVALLMRAHDMAVPLLAAADIDGFCRFFNKISYRVHHCELQGLKVVVGCEVADIAAISGKTEKTVEGILSRFGYTTANGIVVRHDRPGRPEDVIIFSPPPPAL